MSIYSDITPGSVIKSIQRGTISVSGSSATATISAVVTAKSTIHDLSFKCGPGNQDSSHAHLVLTDTTTITSTRSGTFDTLIHSFVIVEFE